MGAVYDVVWGLYLATPALKCGISIVKLRVILLKVSVLRAYGDELPEDRLC